jgi:aryl-alcohol dehydrogenase-like predicted oxidoreductase
LSIPPLGIGAWSWGETFFWGYGKGYGEEDIRGAFDRCLQAGINFFDTAEVYGSGKSELLLGKMLKAGGGTAIVATKFFPFPHRLTQGSLLRALRGSLRRLGLTSLDLYQIHQPVPPVPVRVWMEALAKAVREGKIRAAGVSNYNANKTRQAHAALARFGIPLASNQISFSLLNRQPEESGLLSLCRDLGVTVIAYSPLMQGMLTGRYGPDNPPSGIRRFRYSRDYLSRIQPLLAAMGEIGKGRGNKTPAQVALNWVMCKGAVPIPGVKNKRQAEDILGALGWRLTAEEVAALDAASRNL